MRLPLCRRCVECLTFIFELLVVHSLLHSPFSLPPVTEEVPDTTLGPGLLLESYWDPSELLVVELLVVLSCVLLGEFFHWCSEAGFSVYSGRRAESLVFYADTLYIAMPLHAYSPSR